MAATARCVFGAEQIRGWQAANPTQEIGSLLGQCLASAEGVSKEVHLLFLEELAKRTDARRNGKKGPHGFLDKLAARSKGKMQPFL